MKGAEDYFSLTAGGLTLEGRSRAGNETWIRVRELGLALDVGKGPDPLIGTSRLFVSHVHLDHFGGVPFLASQRSMQGLPPPTVWLPQESLRIARELIEVHERLEECRYPVDLIGASPGDRFELRKGLEARPHRAPHRLPSVAWEFLERRVKLRTEFRHLPGEVLGEMKRTRPDAFETRYSSRLFYSGDCDAGIFDSAPALFESAVTILECTYVADGERERAAQWRHLHADDIFDHAERFRSEAIVLVHFTLRESVERIHREISARCPVVLRERLLLALPEPWNRVR